MEDKTVTSNTVYMIKLLFTHFVYSSACKVSVNTFIKLIFQNFNKDRSDYLATRRDLQTGSVFNGMIHPFTFLSIKGIVFIQGILNVFPNSI